MSDKMAHGAEAHKNLQRKCVMQTAFFKVYRKLQSQCAQGANKFKRKLVKTLQLKFDFIACAQCLKGELSNDV